jgi:hypothetical protein
MSSDVISGSRSGLQLELGIAQLAHFGNIESLEFRLGADALTDDYIDKQVDHEAE